MLLLMTAALPWKVARNRAVSLALEVVEEEEVVVEGGAAVGARGGEVREGRRGGGWEEGRRGCM
jgi:hypothetical protein